MSILTYSGPALRLLSAAAVFALTGCAGNPSQPSMTPGSPSSTAPTADVSSSAPDQTASTPGSGERETAAERCIGQPGPGHTRSVPVGSSKLVAAELGHGHTWAVMLHQTDRDGLCGWWPYATWLSGRGVHVLLLDMCGYGDSSCAAKVTNDQARQAAAAVAWARDRNAHRVTLVGASMGGAVALPAAVRASADAVADLSGPPDWVGTDLERDARRLTMPTLLAVSPTDPAFIPAYRRALPLIRSERKKLIVYAGGHGYEMLGYHHSWSALGHRVLRWIEGRYSDETRATRQPSR